MIDCDESVLRERERDREKGKGENWEERISVIKLKWWDEKKLTHKMPNQSGSVNFLGSTAFFIRYS